MSRSLITGATGFIGGRLALALRREGVEVRALTRPGSDTQSLEAAGVEVVRGDAGDFATMRAAMDGCPFVYHLAAARAAAKLERRAYREQNERLSEVVGRAAVAAGVQRVVVASTAALTGYWGPARQTEDTPARPNSPYRASRVTSERIFDRFGERDGLDVVTARVSQRVMGPGARDWAGPVRAVRDGRIRVLPAGGSVHSTDVDDVVDALRRCAVVPGIAGRRFLLGAADPIATKALLRLVAEHLGVSFAPRIVSVAPFKAWVGLGNLVYRTTGLELPYHYTAEFYSARVAYDTARASRELAWAPRFELPVSVGRTVSWLRENGLV